MRLYSCSSIRFLSRKSFKNCNRFPSSSESEGEDSLGWEFFSARVAGCFGEGAWEELTSIKQLVEQYRKSPVASRESNNFQIDEINIPTAQCGMCEKNIENALNGIDGIFKYKVELETYRVQVEYNTDKLSLKIIEKLISKAGYQANNYPADVDAYNKLAKCCKLPKLQTCRCKTSHHF